MIYFCRFWPQANIMYLLQHLAEDLATPVFQIDRSSKHCKTPRRNAEVEDLDMSTTIFWNRSLACRGVPEIISNKWMWCIIPEISWDHNYWSLYTVSLFHEDPLDPSCSMPQLQRSDDAPGAAFLPADFSTLGHLAMRRDAQRHWAKFHVTW